MSLDLDPRQRAMLQEMGLRVWLPAAVPPEPVVVAAIVAPAVPPPRTDAAPVAPTPIPSPSAIAIKIIATNALATRTSTLKESKNRESAPATATPAAQTDDLTCMDWPTLAHTIAHCQSCKLCTGRVSPVFGTDQTPAQADWLVVGEPPDDNEERAITAITGQAGQLLDNILRAVGVSRHGAPDKATGAYVTNVVKCRPAVARIPDPQELAICEHYLRQEVALVQPKVILALGRFAAQTLLHTCVPEVANIPLGKLRGKIYRYQGIPVVVSYHPNYLLRTPQDKARAWADWCLALNEIRSA